jgi:SPX domain protein involved in polyphosphate accumulation
VLQPCVKICVPYTALCPQISLMEEFGHRFAMAVIPKISEKYIPYEELYDLIKSLENEDDCVDLFYQKLELSYHRCKNHAEKWLNDVMLGSVSGNVLEEVMELNGFISINQQALQRIISLHDMRFSTSKLFVSWRSPHQNPLSLLLPLSSLPPLPSSRPLIAISS